MTDIKALSRNIRKQSIFEKLDIPRPGLKLLVDPAEQLGTADGEKLGPNLVKNGDFSDFTMGSVAAANLKGHWIFNDEAVRRKSHPIGDRYCASLDGVDDYFSLANGAPSADLLPGTGDATMAVWFYKDKADSNGNMVMKGSWTNGYWAIGRMSSGSAVQLRYYDGAIKNCTAATWSTIPVGWYHVAFVIDRSIGTYGAVHAYFNGKYVTTNLFTTDLNFNNSDAFGIGASNGGSEKQKTDIGEFGYWNRACTGAEIAQHAKGVLPASPVVHYKFDSSIQANNITDKSGNGHTLSANSAPSYVSGKTRSIAQDWSQGGAIWSGNLVSESSPNASEFTDNGTTWWTATRGTFSHNSGTQDATFTVTDDTGQLRIEKTGIITQGTRVRVSFRAKSAHTTSKMSLNGESAYFADVLEIKNPNLSSSYQEYIFEGYVGSANKLTIIFPDDLVNGQSVTIDSIKCQKIGGAGNHLNVASTYDVSSKFIEDAPNYKDGKSLRTEGTGQYLALGAASCADFIPGTGSFSFGIKLKINGDVATGSDGYFGWVREGFNLGTGPHWAIRRYYDGRIMTQMAPAAGGPYLQTFSSATYSSANGWLTAIATYDHTTGTLKLYINGVEVGSNSWTPVEITDGTSYLQIMRPFSGTIFADFAEAAYWNKTLIVNEVKQASGLGDGWVNAATPPLNAYNTGFGQTVEGGNGLNNGILQYLTLTPGVLYKAEVDFTNVSGANNKQFFIARNYSPWSSFFLAQTTDNTLKNGKNTFYFSVDGTSVTLNIRESSAGGNVSLWDNVSVRPVLINRVPFGYIENLADGGIRVVADSEKITGMWNGTTYAYETFITKDNDVFSSVNSADYGGCASNSIAVTAGKKYRVSLDLVVNSGSNPDIRITTGNNGRGTVRHYLHENAPSGYHSLLFEAATTETVYLEISNDNGQTTNYSVRNISLTEVEYGLVGLLSGGISSGQPAHPAAYRFDKVDDYIDFGTSLDVGLDDVIICGWGYYTGMQTGFCVMKLDSFGGARWGVFMRNDGSLSNGIFCYFADTSGSFIYPTSNPNSLTLNKWSFVSVVIDRKNGRCRIYVNGILVGDVDISVLTNSLNTTSFSLRFGRYANPPTYTGGDQGLTGIYVFDGKDGAPSSLPSDEVNWIRRIYNSSKNRYDKTLPTVSLDKPAAIENWTPVHSKGALKLLFDPGRQRRAGWSNTIANPALINYANFNKGQSVLKPNMSNHYSAAEWTYAAMSDTVGKFTCTGNTNPNIALIHALSNPPIDYTKYYYIEFEAYSPTITTAPAVGGFNQNPLANVTKALTTTWQKQIILTKPNGTIHLYCGNTISSELYVRNARAYVLDIDMVGFLNGGLNATGWGGHSAGLLFDGVNDYARFADNFNVRIHDYILFAWAKVPATVSNNKPLLDKGGSYGPNYKEYQLLITSAKKASTGMNDGSGTAALGLVGTTVLSSGEWYLIAAVVKRHQMQKLFVNMNLEASDTKNLAVDIWDSSRMFEIGVTRGSIFPYNDLIGISGIYIFDGINGAPALLPYDWENIVREIYNNTKNTYNAALPAVPMLDIATPEPWTPVLHKEALKLLIDPYRQHLEGWNTERANKLVKDYGGNLVLGSELVADGDMEAAGTTGWNNVGSPTSVAKDTTTFNSGSQSIKVVTTTTQTGTARNITTVVGKLYQVTQYVKCSNNIYIGAVGSGWDNLLTINTNGKWEKFTYTFKATATTTALRIQTDGSTTNATFWGDDFSVKEISGGNHGIATGSLELTGWQKEWGGVKFDQTNDIVEFGDVLNPRTHSFILFAWVKNNQTTGAGRIWSKQLNSPLTAFYLRAETTGAFRVGLLADGQTPNFFSSAYPKNQWTFVAAIFDRSGSLKLSVNKVLDANTVDISALSSFDFNVTDSLRWGGWTSEVVNDGAGISGIYLFDGQDGAVSAMPADYEDIIDEIYESTKAIYGIE